MLLFLFLIIDLYFLIPAANGNFQSYYRTQAKAGIEIHPVIVGTEIRRC